MIKGMSTFLPLLTFEHHRVEKAIPTGDVLLSSVGLSRSSSSDAADHLIGQQHQTARNYSKNLDSNVGQIAFQSKRCVLNIDKCCTEL